MPHLVVLYTGNLDAPIEQGGSDIARLCRSLADAMLGVRGDEGDAVFPPGGTRVLAYPAPHFAVSDGGAAGRAAGGSGDYAFVYLNLRMGRGRSAATHRKVGDLLLAVAQRHFEPQFASRHIGLTLQIDEGHEVYNGRQSTLHSLFDKG